MSKTMLNSLSLILMFVVLSIVLFVGVGGNTGRTRLNMSPDEIRNVLSVHLSNGRHIDILTLLEQVEQAYGTLLIDRNTPHLYIFRGVALHSTQRLAEAAVAFEEGLKYFPNDTRCLINLGEAQSQLFHLDKAADAFVRAEALGDKFALVRLLKTKGWADSWHDFERIAANVEQEAMKCLVMDAHGQWALTTTTPCYLDSSGGLEYTDTPGWTEKIFTAVSPNARSSPFTVPVNDIAKLWVESIESRPLYQPATNIIASARATWRGTGKSGQKHDLGDDSMTRGKSVSTSSSLQHRRLKVGVVSSDFGVHPVATLVRGLLQYIDRKKIELYCFSLNPVVSWWGENVTNTVEHFVWLQYMNTPDAAASIAARGIEILIDLNGHTLNGGLPIMAHRPAPIQMSFLGLPTTTGTHPHPYPYPRYPHFHPHHPHPYLGRTLRPNHPQLITAQTFHLV